MPGSYCSVPNCDLNSLLNKGTSFHLFPKNVQERKYFVKTINRKGRNKMNLWQPGKYSKLCGYHFKNLKSNYKKFLIKTETENNRRKTYIKWTTNNRLLDIGAEVTLGMTNDALPKENFYYIKTQNKNTIISDEHNYFSSKTVIDLQDQILCLRSKINKAEQKLKQHTQGLNHYKAKYEEALKYISKMKSSSLWNIGKIISNEKQLQFYTGFKNKTYFENFIKFIKPAYDIASNSKIKYTSSRAILTFTQQLFLVLTRLRLGLYEMDLACRFGVSQSTVSKIWTFWIDLLCTQLTQVPLWPSKHIVNKYMPNTLKEKYPNTRIILDCTEIYIDTPSDFRVQSATYSTYKSHNTAKGLLGITPNGMVVFVSDLYGGRTSDKEIFRDCGLLNLLEENDDVMADRGFLIKEILEEKNITLNIPPFLNGQIQFNEAEMLRTKNIANERIIVERVIKHVKSFKILKHIFPNSMSSKLNSIWKTCSILVNFIDEPVMDRC